MGKELLERYNIFKERIKSRLNGFKELDENSQFKEFMFCLLTPQSNAKKCWEAVKEIKNIGFKKIGSKKLIEILRKNTRFHNNRSLLDKVLN